ncbi:unnamed protein product [Parajaminaea phylloscopi]
MWKVALLLSLGCVAHAIQLSTLPNRNADGFLRLLSDSGSRSQLQHGEYIEKTTADKYPDIVAATLTQPLDHFDGTTNLTFEQRYWYSLRHYKPPSKRASGEPVPIFILDSGETNAEGRLGYLDHGILDILTSAVGGIGVVLEHRYYGKSYPDRKAFGPGQAWNVDELRWLNNRQALEDSADFVRRATFEGLADADAQAGRHGRVHISYGGSYPGARSAHLRVLYPDLFYGAFASSAVPAALEEFPQYLFPLARGANQTAIQALQAAVASLDLILAPEPHKGRRQTNRDAAKVSALLDLAGLKGLSEPADFAQLSFYPLGDWQSTNWDQAISPPDFVHFEDALVHTPESRLGPLRERAHELGFRQGEIADEALRLISYLRRTLIDPCVAQGGHTPDKCFGSGNYTGFINNPKLTSGKAWTFQVCTQWGFFQTAPKLARPGGPFVASGPRLLSSLVDLEYTSEVCRKGFPAGKHFAIPEHPDVDAVNVLGNFSIAHSRLGFLDGQYDPWREASVHSETFAQGGARPHTLDQPFILIPNATHHWDENGVAHDGTSSPEPAYISAVHAEMVKAVRFWLSEWSPAA